MKSQRKSMSRARRLTGISILAGSMMLLSACDENGQFSLKNPASGTGEAGQANAPSKSVKLIERDIEAPDVFQVTEAGLWDGRPSLGGVWVAHPDVKDPERVIIRNTSNGKFVIGALFRRERANPGPRLQVSSDAAAALGMLAGAPNQLNVTALRREEVPSTPETTEAEPLNDPAAVEASTLDPVTASAGAAIAKAEATPATTSSGAIKPPVKPAAAPAPKPVTKTAGSALAKPYLQIGIFSVEQNAKNTATAMRQAGMVPTVKKQSTSGKTFWRVLVGPATSKGERAALLKKIKANGFADAYAVTN